jgi:hypothetical protein
VASLTHEREDALRWARGARQEAAELASSPAAACTGAGRFAGGANVTTRGLRMSTAARARARGARSSGTGPTGRSTTCSSTSTRRSPPAGLAQCAAYETRMAATHRISVLQPVRKKRSRLTFSRRRRATMIDLRRTAGRRRRLLFV